MDGGFNDASPELSADVDSEGFVMPLIRPTRSETMTPWNRIFEELVGIDEDATAA